MKDFLHDRWAGLSHIPDLGEGHNQRPIGQPVWVDDTDARRLTAYRVLQSIQDNCRRYWFSNDMWARPTSALGEKQIEYGRSEAEKWREYGHPGLIVDTARSIVLGSDQTVVLPDLDDTATGPLRETGDWLLAWARQERLRAQLLTGEQHAIGDGDGVYTLMWSQAKQRPRLKVWNPGFYFPDLLAIDTTPGWEEDFPPVVHLAWEWTDPDGVVRLRQHTWRMIRLDANAPAGLPRAPVAAAWDGRREWTCVYSLTDYRIDRLKGEFTIYTLEPGRDGAEPVIAPVDLGLDFIPLVHVPNTEPGGYHFGESLLTRPAQVLDDLSGSDTDLAVTASESAAPPAVFTGAGAAREMPGGPAQSWWGPDGAGMGYADTSRVLIAGLQQNRNLLEHLAINTRLSMSLLGRVTPSEVPSGYALQLGFAPAIALMREMRLVRAEKYELLLKFVLRMAQANKVLPGGKTPAAVLDFGSGLPSDEAAAIDSVKALLPIFAISTDTAVRILQAAGLPIEDAEAEVDAIRAESYTKAVALVDATGDVQAAYDLLGLKRPAPDPTPPPAPAVPPTVPPAPSPVPPVGGTA